MRLELGSTVKRLAAAQLVDALANELAPRRMVAAHLDHLGVAPVLRPLLPIIKVSSSVGLVVGLRWPRVGAVTAAGLVGYYIAAAGYHLRAGDHPVLALPALGFGAGALRAFAGLCNANRHQRIHTTATPL